MSEYGGCTLSFCNWQDMEGYAIEGAIEISSCEDCPYYDPELFRQEAKDESDS